MAKRASAVLQVETLVELLRERADSLPDRVGYTYLRDGRTDEESLTYSELDRRSRTVAALLQSRVQPGDRVLVCHGPGLDYLAAFFGCLYAGVVAVPVYPPRFSQKLERLVALVQDAAPRIALTSQSISATLYPLLAQNAALSALEWIDSAESSEFAPGEWRAPDLRAEDTAFLQYTSGSIASPKGVVLTHSNLLANLQSISGHVRCA